MKTLYVEDDPDLQEAVASAFGVEAVSDLGSRSSGKAALRGHDAEPMWSSDGLLLDMVTPEMDGVATLRAIRRRWVQAETTAVSISAKRDPTLVDVALPVAGFRETPFYPMVLGGQLLQLFSEAGAPAREAQSGEVAWPSTATRAPQSV